MKYRKLCWALVLALSTSMAFLSTLQAQNKGKAKKPAGRDLCMGHYNVENLFDTLDDPATDDQDFLPTASLAWEKPVITRK